MRKMKDLHPRFLAEGARIKNIKKASQAICMYFCIRMRRRIFNFLIGFWVVSIVLTPASLQVLGMTCLSSGKTQWRIQENFSCCKPSESGRAHFQAKCCEFVKIQLKTDKEKISSVYRIYPLIAEGSRLEFKYSQTEIEKGKVWKPDSGPPRYLEVCLPFLSRYNI